jgi:Recombination endonuclease VII
MREAKARLYGSEKQYQLRRRYGMDEVDLAWLSLRQGNVCAICGKAGGLHVDHDHESGRVRGLLCFNCNRALGYLQDDLDVLRGALNYLKAGQ